MIRIDLENHFYAPCLIDALAQRSQPPFYDRATDQIHWTEDVCMPQGELLQRLLEVGEHRLSLLEQQGITATVRRKLGGDIDASCGQLRRKRMQEQE